MSSLAQCLRKMGKLLSPVEAKELRSAADEYLEEGFDGERANQQAVEDVLRELDGDLESILRQTAPPVVVAAPVPEKAVPLPYGAIIEGEPSLDFRAWTMPVRPAQWENLVAKNLKHPEAAKGDKEGKRSLTRVGLVLLEPDGKGVIMAGIVTPQAGVEPVTGTAKIKGPALQQMGSGPKTRLIAVGGDQPVAVRDVTAAGFKPLGIVHFTGEPARIFQRFADLAAFDRAFGATEKATRRPSDALAVTPRAEQQARDAARTEAELDAAIDQIGAELQAPGLTEARESELNTRLIELFEQRSKVLRGGQSQVGDVAFQAQPLRLRRPMAALERMARENASWRDWYSDFQDELERFFGPDAGLFQKILAVTSQNTSVKGNVTLAIKAYVQFQNNDPFTGYLPAVAINLGRVRTEEQVGGRKIGNFTRATAGDESAITVDRHIAQLFFGVTVPSRAQYEKAEQIIRQLAKKLGWTPGQVQASLWAANIERSGKEPQTYHDYLGVLERDGRLAGWLAQIRGSDTGSQGSGSSTSERGAASGGSVAFQQNDPSRVAIEATRTQEFSAVLDRLRRQGAKVDVFAQTLFRLGVRVEIEAQLAQLQQREAEATTESQRRALAREIARRQARLGEIDQARGATFSPWHISLAVGDVQNATMGNLVTLLHEAAEALTMGLNPVMKGRVSRAIQNSLTELQKRRDAAAARTGTPAAAETGGFDLLAETLAQNLAAEGVPESPGYARAILNWIKDLYYRTAMALQAAFGAEPSDQMALDWFENQLERIVGGDYDYRIARLLDRFLPEQMSARVARFQRPTGTPAGMTDYWNPFSQQMEQPGVLPDTEESAGWNIEFQTVAAQQDIEGPEARGRILGAGWNRYIDHLEAVRTAANITTPWAQWWAQFNAGDDPRVLLATLASRMPGAEAAKVGGDRMTAPMSALAALEARRLLENFQAKLIAQQAKSKEQIDTEADATIAAAREVNRIEADRRNAELQEGLLQKKIKDLVRRFVKDTSTGYRLAEQQGELAAAVREAEALVDGDPIPERYQQVFKAVMDGEVAVFDYVRAIARLDLPLSDLTQAELVKAIRDNADSNETLAALVRNRPLMTALTVMARTNAGVVDEIHLGWLQDADEYRRIHDELQTIRNASDAQFQEMLTAQDKRVKAVGLLDRLRKDYLKRRRTLQDARKRVQRAQARVAAVEPLVGPLNDVVEAAQAQGSEAPSEWSPTEGAIFTEMTPTATGWTKKTRELRFRPDGSAVDGDALRTAIGRNKQWLEAHPRKKGGKLWQDVERQTMQLAAIDIQAKYATAHARGMDTYLAPLMTEARNLGGIGPQVAQRLAFFEHIRFTNRQQVKANAHEWSRAWKDVQKATGIKDNGALHQQIYDPVSYMLNTEPGLDEQVAIREATRMARSRLAKPPGDTFNAAMERLLRASKTGFETLVRIAEESGAFVKDPALQSEMRRAVARGWLTSLRSIDTGLVQRLTRDMERLGWKVAREFVKDSRERDRLKSVKPATFRDLDAADAANDQGMVTALARLFPDPIVRDWLLPFINKGGTEVFRFGKLEIPQAVLQDAWTQTAGAPDNGQRVLAWIDLVGEQAGVAEEAVGDENPIADFRLAMLHQLDALFATELKLAADASQTRDMFDPFGPQPHVVMDARTNDQIPPEHLDFALLDDQTSGMLLAEIAFHSAFGRNGERMVSLLDSMRQKAKAAKVDYEGLKMTTRNGRVAEALVLGWKDFKELERLAVLADDLHRFQDKLEGFMGVGHPGGPFDTTSRAWMSVLNFVTGQIVDNPKTAFYNLLNLAQPPFAQRSLGPEALRTVADAFVTTAKTGFGSLLEAMHLHFMHASAQELDVTQATGGSRNLPWRVALSDIGPAGRQGWKETVFIRPLQAIRYVQNKGVGLPLQGQAKDFPRLAIVPGLGVSNFVSQIAARGGMMAQVGQLERMMARGAQYFATHRDDAADPSFRFKARDLGMGRMDAGIFDWWRVKSVEYGLGTLEDLVRSGMPALAKGERVISRDQLLRVAGATATELNGDSSINTMPSLLVTHPFLRTFFPLLRWPFWAMHKTWENMGSVEGRRDWKTYTRGLAILAAWNLPIGLAFTFLLDEYDDKLLGKKSNLPGVGGVAALPFLGPAAELLTSDRSVPDTLTAYLVRGARAGNLGGIAADFAGQMASPSDSASGRRTFSLDQRVLVMSQLLNLQQAVSNAAHQDWTTTWASFWHPLFRSVGGNGALHVLDVANNVLGLDNAESRQVTRANASNWLRAGAGELKMELRAGGSGTPTPMSVWTRSMLDSAMANDRIGFMESYRKALDAARKVVGSDPSVSPMDREREAERRVLSGWRSRDPLSIFGRKPTEQEVRRLLSIMDPDGAGEVRDALNRYNVFSRLIRVSPEQAKERAFERRLQRPALPNMFRTTQVPQY